MSPTTAQKDLAAWWADETSLALVRRARLGAVQTTLNVEDLVAEEEKDEEELLEQTGPILSSDADIEKALVWWASPHPLSLYDHREPTALASMNMMLVDAPGTSSKALSSSKKGSSVSGHRIIGDDAKSRCSARGEVDQSGLEKGQDRQSQSRFRLQEE